VGVFFTSEGISLLLPGKNDDFSEMSMRFLHARESSHVSAEQSFPGGFLALLPGITFYSECRLV